MGKSWTELSNHVKRISYSKPAKGTSDIVGVRSCYVPIMKQDTSKPAGENGN